jgi:hypothetical protein
VVDGGGLENHCTRKGTGGSNPSPSETYTSGVTSLCAYLSERTFAAKPDRRDCPSQLSESTRDGDAQRVQSTDWNAAVLFANDDAGNCLAHARLLA